MDLYNWLCLSILPKYSIESHISFLLSAYDTAYGQTGGNSEITFYMSYIFSPDSATSSMGTFCS